MDISVYLHGSVTLADAALERVLRISVEDDATVGTLLDELLRRHPALFGVSAAADAARGTTINLFAGPVQLRDRKARLHDQLRPGQRLSVALMRPIPGG